LRIQVAVTYRNPTETIFSRETETASTIKFESQASGCLAAWRAIIAGQVSNEVPEKERYPGPPV